MQILSRIFKLLYCQCKTNVLCLIVIKCINKGWYFPLLSTSIMTIKLMIQYDLSLHYDDKMSAYLEDMYMQMYCTSDQEGTP